jgi:hypothetical protein
MTKTITAKFLTVPRAAYRYCAGAAIVLTVVLTIRAAEPGPKFYPDDPLAVEPETQDASKVSPWKIDLMYDLVLNQFARPGLPAGSRAQNVNTVDEVPDSSWFTNRVLARPVSIEETVRGAATSGGPVPGPWVVIAAKTEGAAPGFTIRDSAGVTWFLAFDPKSNPEGATGAAAVASRIFWTLGYYQAEYYIAELHPASLTVDADATFRPPSGRERKMTLKDIQPVLRRVARKTDGSYRVLASRLLPGRVLGGFKYYGTRSDDPNDIVPHENRRELRALKVFGAWTNLVDMKALNTMDTLITENGQGRVRHYLLDVGSTFGIGANGPREWTEGHEYLFEGDKTLKRMASLGFYIQPWQTTPYKEYPSIGRFEGDHFDPLAWKTRVPASAVERAREDDLFWASRRVMAFSDEMIRAVVKTGQYSDPEAEKHLADVLIKRRNKIGECYFTRMNPLVDFSLTASHLKFRNEAVKTGVAVAPSSYAGAWFTFDNSTGATQGLGETSASDEQLPVPASLRPVEGSFILAEVRAAASPHPAWTKPVKVYFKRLKDSWKLVGVERMPGDVTPSSESVVSRR